MNGKDIVKIIDAELLKRNMTQQQFCELIGIRSSAYSAWRKGSMPKVDRIRAIEDFLGYQIDISTASREDSDTEELLQQLKDRQDLRILLRSAQDVPASSVYALISQIEKMKENETDREL